MEQRLEPGLCWIWKRSLAGFGNCLTPPGYGGLRSLSNVLIFKSLHLALQAWSLIDWSSSGEFPGFASLHFFNLIINSSGPRCAREGPAHIFLSSLVLFAPHTCFYCLAQYGGCYPGWVPREGLFYWWRAFADVLSHWDRKWWSWRFPPIATLQPCWRTGSRTNEASDWQRLCLSFKVDCRVCPYNWIQSIIIINADSQNSTLR